MSATLPASNLNVITIESYQIFRLAHLGLSLAASMLALSPQPVSGSLTSRSTSFTICHHSYFYRLFKLLLGGEKSSRRAAAGNKDLIPIARREK